VRAVQSALALLGFQQVVDVDAEMKAAGTEANLREDLRIHDASPVLVVDIKGVAGKPTDSDALQAQKHTLMYIQQQSRPDVRSLSIINHQRLVPPLDRENALPFRQELLDAATQGNLGLMTTFDLFRLVRGFIRHQWSPDNVMPIFYHTGRIYSHPQHYVFAGRVKQVWKAAFSVVIESGDIIVGDRIAIELPIDFEEQAVESLRLDDADVETAGVGAEVGIGRPVLSQALKTGLAVFRIKRPAERE
jgi:hypothetical protein